MTTIRLDSDCERRLLDVAHALIDQTASRIIVHPNQPAAGFWFGGGNLIADGDALFLAGRYRNAGDSRLGLGQGDRGLELAIFRSTDQGASFDKIASFSKGAVSPPGHTVVSIEGSALWRSNSGIELFVSSEKTSLAYPDEVASFQKPGTGVWSIDQLSAQHIDDWGSTSCREVIRSSSPEFLHLKDPWIFRQGNHLQLGFCSHPFSWTSSNTAIASLTSTDGVLEPNFRCFPRGTTWDVAMTRTTCIIDLPRTGRLRDIQVSLLFYDGGECVRKLDEHPSAVKRPRGYSCEELGGLAYMLDHRWENVHRLSRHAPAFISPWGTGCSRYVSVLATPNGMYAIWQQSQPDFSQPLVMNFLDKSQIEKRLA